MIVFSHRRWQIPITINRTTARIIKMCNDMIFFLIVSHLHQPISLVKAGSFWHIEFNVQEVFLLKILLAYRRFYSLLLDCVWNASYFINFTFHYVTSLKRKCMKPHINVDGHWMYWVLTVCLNIKRNNLKLKIQQSHFFLFPSNGSFNGKRRRETGHEIDC